MPDFPSTTSPSALTSYRILIIDDEPANVRLLERLLDEAGYANFRGTTDSRQALPLYQEFEPDLILLDLSMPHLDGSAVMRQICARTPAEAYLPILVLTADITPRAKQRALSAGARDFLTKPFDLTEVLLRIRNLLETRHLHLQLAAHNAALEETVRNRTRDLEQAQYEILDRLSMAAEYRDDVTGEHAKRVGFLSERLALALGVPPHQAEIIRHAATLHDLGKIGIPDSILLKQGALSSEEKEVMKTHTLIGARILSGSRLRRSPKLTRPCSRKVTQAF
jgi:putative two-component system response regulator